MNKPTTALFTILGALATQSSLTAQTRWNIADGDYFEGASWNTGVVPGENDTVWVDNPGWSSNKKVIECREWSRMILVNESRE